MGIVDEEVHHDITSSWSVEPLGYDRGHRDIGCR